MGRLERRIFALNDELARLQAEARQAQAELDTHRSLADDAARDAAVFATPLDREDERETVSDVKRFEGLVAHFAERIASATVKRDRLLDKLH